MFQNTCVLGALRGGHGTDDSEKGSVRNIIKWVSVPFYGLESTFLFSFNPHSHPRAFVIPIVHMEKLRSGKFRLKVTKLISSKPGPGAPCASTKVCRGSFPVPALLDNLHQDNRRGQ